MERWPALRVDDWENTRRTLHMILQIVGKIRLSSTPLINQWWNASLEMSARGLRTGLMHPPGGTFDAEVDLVDHELVLRALDGRRVTVPLAASSIADFWGATQDAMGRIDVDCTIVASPNEVSPAIPFAEDTKPAEYDADSANTWWRQLVAAQNVFEAHRAGFGGKASPVQLFWGSMDLSVTRFSGRAAPAWKGASPPNCPEWIMAEAEREENAAAGFWPGGSAEGSFYAYAVPQPDGYTDADLSPATFDESIGEWILPYETVRTADDPDATLLSFLDRAYALAADNAVWDRQALDLDPHRLDAHVSGPATYVWPGQSPRS